MDPYIQFRSNNVGVFSEPTPSQVETSPSQLNNNADSASGQKKTRCPTQMRNIWGTRDGERVEVNFNELGQPDEDSATKLSLFIGTIVRDGKNAPLIYEDWHKVPEHYKDHIWALVQSKFDLPSHARTWVMKCSGKKLKDWKATIKKNYYREHLSFEQQKLYKDRRVYADQWEHLIKYWANEKVKEQSERKKSSRTKRKYNHTTGSKRFPCVRNEQKKKLGHSPTRVHMFKVCYTKKNGTPNGEATREIMEEMDERATLNPNLSNEGTSPNDIFAQVMGKEKHGRVRMYGLGVSPSNLWKDTASHKANQNTTMVAMQAELLELRSQVQDLTSRFVHAPTNLTNGSTQVPHASSPHEMAARHQVGSSSSIQDTSPTQVGDIVVLKSICRPMETIAIGVLHSTDPSKEVEGEELGPDFWEVHIQVPVKPYERLMRTYGLVKTIGQGCWSSCCLACSICDFTSRRC